MSTQKNMYIATTDLGSLGRAFFIVLLLLILRCILLLKYFEKYYKTRLLRLKAVKIDSWVRGFCLSFDWFSDIVFCLSHNWYRDTVFCLSFKLLRYTVFCLSNNWSRNTVFCLSFNCLSDTVSFLRCYQWINNHDCYLMQTYPTNNFISIRKNR